MEPFNSANALPLIGGALQVDLATQLFASPESEREQELLTFVQYFSPPCANGYYWKAEVSDCVPKVNERSAKCPWGYIMNTRMRECRRQKYHAGPQQSGKIHKAWDKAVNPREESPTRVTPMRSKTTLYTDGWFGYGYDFNKDDSPF
ncbi:hypothetical protein KR093_004311 [Drosophila rubida]|uniref:Uncharacterized protein n=1 Tax=Drosophila rubida TaxID=30044 RepID=A0AAD4K9P7_9MUSC|nr:hypothetical protein KR093_004311 [Drosophila rubida]